MLPILPSLPLPPQAAFSYIEQPTSVSLFSGCCNKNSVGWVACRANVAFPQFPRLGRPRSRCQQTPWLTGGCLGRGSSLGSCIRALIPFLRAPTP